MSPSWSFFDGKISDSFILRFVYSDPKKPEKYNFQLFMRLPNIRKQDYHGPA